MIKSYIKEYQLNYNTHTWKILEHNNRRTTLASTIYYICSVCKHTVYLNEDKQNSYTGSNHFKM